MKVIAYELKYGMKGKVKSGRCYKSELRFDDKAGDKMIDNGRRVVSKLHFEAGLILMKSNITRIMQVTFDISI